MKLSETLTEAGAPQEQIDAALAMENTMAESGTKISELKSEARGYRTKASAATTELEKYSGVNLEELAALKEKDLKAAGDFETLKEDLTTRFSEKEKGYTDQISSLSSRLEKEAIDKNLLAAASSLDAIDPAQVSSLLRGNVKLEADGTISVMKGDKVRTDGHGENLTLAAYVDEWLKDNLHMVKGKGGGGGSGGGSGGEGDGKTMTLADFNALDPRGKANYMKEGGKVSG